MPATHPVAEDSLGCTSKHRYRNVPSVRPWRMQENNVSPAGNCWGIPAELHIERPSGEPDLAVQRFVDGHGMAAMENVHPSAAQVHKCFSITEQFARDTYKMGSPLKPSLHRVGRHSLLCVKHALTRFACGIYGQQHAAFLVQLIAGSSSTRLHFHKLARISPSSFGGMARRKATLASSRRRTRRPGPLPAAAR